MLRYLVVLGCLLNNRCSTLDLGESLASPATHAVHSIMSFKGTCRAPLGIQSGAIPDSSLQASSSLDVSLGAQTARIRSAIEGGGWCPKTLIDSQSEEYLQVNFANLTVITLIETQGRHGPFQVGPNA